MNILATDVEKTAATAGESFPAPVNLSGCGRAGLRQLLGAAGIRESAIGMRSQQIWHWLYFRGATDFADMTNISKTLRHDLAERFIIRRPEIVDAQKSTDGTRKWLLRYSDGNEVECVFIPEENRGTLCVSSQVGCTLNCRFCLTGTQTRVRNLTSAEIIQQMMVARDELEEWPRGTENRQITNVVFMGMGEPLYNFDNVKEAIDVFADGEGIALSRRRITLSTAGVVPMMAKCGTEIGVNLAVSLHAVRDEIRDQIVPLNRRYNIAELLAACQAYPGASNARRITFEYILLDGINDSLADAKELVRLLRRYQLPAKVNLIPFNPWPGAPYACSNERAINAFSEYVFNAGISAPVRTPRGQDIMAACGQLKSASRHPGARSPAPDSSS